LRRALEDCNVISLLLHAFPTHIDELGATLQLDGVLARIDRLVTLGRERFDADELVRCTIERLWIFAGNLADRHSRDARIPAGAPPWSELVAARHVYAHYLPDQINYDRVWFDTVTDLPRLRRRIRAVVGAG
jgi:uncharacterized protein with HEPN domain